MKTISNESVYEPLRLRGGNGSEHESADGATVEPEEHEPTNTCQRRRARRVGGRRINRSAIRELRLQRDGAVPRRRQQKRSSKATVKIASWNMRGRGLITAVGESMTAENKWLHVNQLVKDKRIGALAVQETHLTDSHVADLHELFGKRLRIIHSSDPTNPSQAAGVAIVLNREQVEADQASYKTIIPGRAILVSLPWSDERPLNILAVYAPNLNKYNDEGENLNALFWTEIIAKLDELPHAQVIDIMLGDTNMVEDGIDRLPTHADNTAAADTLDNLKLMYNLSDGWRHAHPTEKAYTYHQKATGSKSRIDRIYTTEGINRDSLSWSIEQPGVETDHKIVAVTIINMKMPCIGKGRWTFPTYMLGNKKLKSKIKKLGIAFQNEIDGSAYPHEWQGPKESLQRRYARFKRDLREVARNFCKVAVPLIQIQLKDLEKDIQQMLNDPEANKEEKVENAAVLEERLSNLERARHSTKRKSSAATNRLRSEVATDKYWAKSNREIRTKDVIRVLNVPGSAPERSTTDTAEMTEVARKYHNNLQTADAEPGGEELREEKIQQALNSIPEGMDVPDVQKERQGRHRELQTANVAERRL
ncbi:DNase I-like protein [Fistulina hepatica ATCC 64428]|uniref:DNase I-like protein n=1 Tax=Fistulina hepatica ATCC 64428 TaxID=1128425 RepID=A0A0D7A416_9AGAR|nr:DNase I-like protein [Fistulina hepatica ATCC 64428]